MKRIALYLRVSTSKQDTENQRRELEAVAARSDWEIVRVFEDAGISGAKGRDDRPGLDALLRAVNSREFDLVAAWSVDRLGRSLTDLLNILQNLKDKRVDLFLHQQGLDTSTTAGKAMFQMLGVFAEFERGIIKERVTAGLARARANGVKLGRGNLKDGKKSADEKRWGMSRTAMTKRIRQLHRGGMGMLKIGRELGVGTGFVRRAVDEPIEKANQKAMAVAVENWIANGQLSAPHDECRPRRGIRGYLQDEVPGGGGQGRLAPCAGRRRPPKMGPP
jgi:DNA invertase Pin-like site-specific DNA recombinase